MYQLLAHAQRFHTDHTPLWKHVLTEPYVMNLLFALGMAALAWAMRNVLQVTNLQRLWITTGYCLLGSFLSYTYNKPLSLIAFSLAILSSLAACFWIIQGLPAPKSKTKKS